MRYTCTDPIFRFFKGLDQVPEASVGEFTHHARKMAQYCQETMKRGGLRQYSLKKIIEPYGAQMWVNVIDNGLGSPLILGKIELSRPIVPGEIADECNLFYYLQLDTNTRFILNAPGGQWRLKEAPLRMVGLSLDGQSKRSFEFAYPDGTEEYDDFPAFWSGWNKRDVVVYQNKKFIGYNGELLFDAKDLAIPESADAVCWTHGWFVILSGDKYYAINKSGDIETFDSSVGPRYAQFNRSATAGIVENGSTLARSSISATADSISISDTTEEMVVADDVTPINTFVSDPGIDQFRYEDEHCEEVFLGEVSCGVHCVYLTMIYNFSSSSFYSNNGIQAVYSTLISDPGFQDDEELLGTSYATRTTTDSVDNTDIVGNDSEPVKVHDDFGFFSAMFGCIVGAHYTDGYIDDSGSVETEIFEDKDATVSNKSWGNFSKSIDEARTQSISVITTYPPCTSITYNQVVVGGDCPSTATIKCNATYTDTGKDESWYVDEIRAVNLFFWVDYERLPQTVTSNSCTDLAVSNKWSEHSVSIRDGDQILESYSEYTWLEVVNYAYNGDQSAIFVVDFVNEDSGNSARKMFGFYERELTDITSLVGGEAALGGYGEEMNLTNFAPLSATNCR